MDEIDGMSESKDFIKNFLTSEIENNPETATNDFLSTKSKKIYERQYEDFIKWCEHNDEHEYTEDIMMNYFNEKSRFYRPSTLWSQYAMLKTMLMMKQNIDISKYTEVLAFLKKKNDGYKPKQSNVLTREQIDQFLIEAPDEIYLVVKVCLILGIAGACRGDELLNISVNDVEDIGSSILFTIKNSKNKMDRTFIVKNNDKSRVNFVDVCRKYMSLRPDETKHSRFFVQFRNNVCTTQPIGKNTFGTLPQKIASFLNLPEASSYTGHCFRRTSASLLTNAGVDIDILRRQNLMKTPPPIPEACCENYPRVSEYLFCSRMNFMSWHHSTQIHQEIVEFGIVLLSVQQDNILHTFHRYIKPYCSPYYTIEGALQEDLDKSKPLKCCLNEFNKWLNNIFISCELTFTASKNKCIFIFDGDSHSIEINNLKNECELKDIKFPDCFNHYEDLSNYTNFVTIGCTCDIDFSNSIKLGLLEDATKIAKKASHMIKQHAYII